MNRQSVRESNRNEHTDDRNTRRWAGKSIRPLTTDFPALDTAELHSEELLEPGAIGLMAWQNQDGSEWTTAKTVCRNDNIELKIEISDVGVSHINLLIEVEPCRFGGSRRWLICPSCGERARVFYISETWQRIDWIVCRNCAGLAYPTNRMRRFQRLENRAERIADLLDWKDDDPCRPKGMHSRTFHRLVTEYFSSVDEAGKAYEEEAASWSGMEARFLKNARRIFNEYCKS